MVDHFASPPASEHRSDEGQLRIWEPRPGVILTRIDGRFSHELALPFIARFEERAREGSVYGIHDWTSMTGFDPSLPPRLITFTMRLLPSVKRIVIATVSPMIAMAVRTGNLTLRRLELVESTAELRQATERAVRDVA